MTKKYSVLAVAAHPDDIEFVMAGTLLLLHEAGCEIHYFNIANGSCGSDALSKEAIVQIREAEARSACEFLGATFYPSLVDDFAIIYTEFMIKKVAAVVRQCQPEILLIPSLKDYMEDHVTAARIAVTAAFVRSMPNYDTDPPVEPIENDIAVYHALPYGLVDEVRQRVVPDLYVDITSVMEKKTEMLRFHRSQKEWLDKSQGIDSYIETVKAMGKEAGDMSGQYTYAEGWQRHAHLGLAQEEFNPLTEILIWRIKNGSI